MRLIHSEISQQVSLNISRRNSLLSKVRLLLIKITGLLSNKQSH